MVLKPSPFFIEVKSGKTFKCIVRPSYKNKFLKKEYALVWTRHFYIPSGQFLVKKLNLDIYYNSED